MIEGMYLQYGRTTLETQESLHMRWHHAEMHKLCLDELPTLFNNNHFLAQRKTLPIKKISLGCRNGGCQDGVVAVEVDGRGIPAQQSLPASIIICY